MNLKKFLSSPWTILGSILLAVAGGVYLPQEVMTLEPIGGIYISLLKVVVLPFLFATILVGVVGLLQKEGSRSMIKRIVIGFLASMFIAAVVGVGSTVLTGSEMTPEKKIQLGALVNNKDQGAEMIITLKEPMPVAPKPSAGAMIQKFIPENIFQSLDAGESLKIVIFCLIFGIALGNIKSVGQEVLIDIFKSVQQASISIFKFLNYFLPIALFAMISTQVAKVGVGIFGTMVDFIIQQTVGGFLIVAIAIVYIAWKSRKGIATTIKGIQETFMIAVSSRSSLACIPYSQDALVKLGYNKDAVELTTPLSFTVNRIGSIVYYAIATAFIAGIYDLHLGVAGLVVVLFGSILAGLASAGTTGILTVATVAVVCDLLRLPSEAVLVLFIAVDPLMDMIRTASHVIGNMGVKAFVAEVENGKVLS